jgi:serine phosphatase RsbU (regulator of sigma subunit)
MPLGILPDTVFQEDIADLESNSRVLLYTDGLADASNAQGESFGQNRLIRWLQSSIDTHHSATQLKQELFEELGRFQAGVSPMDDQTFMILTDEPPANG